MAGPSLNTARDDQTANLLANGQVLIAGGVNFVARLPEGETPVAQTTPEVNPAPTTPYCWTGSGTR